MIRRALAHLPEFDRAIRETGRVLIATDFDGTLCPLADSPSQVSVTPAVFDTLRRLAGYENVRLFVTSGRALNDLATRAPVSAILAGNHGLEMAGPGVAFEHEGARMLRPLLTELCGVLSTAVSEWRGAWVEDKVLTATVHYRRVNRESHHRLRCKVRNTIGRFGSLFSIRAGKDALEIHPRLYWNKGTALEWLKQRLGLSGATCICFGDDRTDESMFAANAGQFNVRVGWPVRSFANFYAADPVEVSAILAHLALRCGRTPAAGLSLVTQAVAIGQPG